MTYYEDPRRFSSRVIGLSFQGPRGRTFLPSGSRCLVSLVFAVKDFLRLSFHRGFRCGPGLSLLPASFGSLQAASGVRSGSRYLVSVVFAVKDFVKLSSATPGFALLPGHALLAKRLASGGVRSGRRCMLPVGVSRQVLLLVSVVFQKTPQFQGLPIEKDSTSVQ